MFDVPFGLPVIIGIFLALVFDFVNGFHDSANAIATIVATRVLTPVKAVAMAAFFNFIGPLLFTTAIAATIGKEIITLDGVEDTTIILIIMAALIGAITWNLITWYLGLPSSSSHALVGGLIGAAIPAMGAASIQFPGMNVIMDLFIYLFIGAVIGMLVWTLIEMALGEKPTSGLLSIGAMVGVCITILILTIFKILPISGLLAVVIYMFASPLIGMGIAFLVTSLVMRLARKSNQHKSNKYFRKLQLVSAAFYSFNHGTNDAQKTMGIIAVLVMISGGAAYSGANFHVPVWVIFSSATAMSFGTFFGGWRIVKTMASKITKLKPYQGFCAETSGGLVLMFTAAFGIPVSTTHAISGSIMGVGATKQFSAVRWGVARRIIWAWIITIPMAALVSGLCYYIIVPFM